MPPTTRRARRSPDGLPTQLSLLFPLLEVLDQAGGAATPAEVADALADKVGLTEAQRTARVFAGAAHGEANQWKRHVRFVRERAKALGFLASPERNLWALTPEGKDGLRGAQPGVLVTIYETDRGEALFGTCETAMQCMVDGSLQLILTSPPYGLARSKEYESRKADENVEWLLHCGRRWFDLLDDEGTLALNVGPAWLGGGMAAQSVWREELILRLVREVGFFKAQTFYWHNPSKLPAPAEFVNVRRIRCTESVEEVFCLVKNPRVSRWSNRAVLTPYSPAMRQRLAAGGEKGATRPSGHVLAAGAFSTDNGGAIPKTMLSIPHTDSNSAYRRHCREHGLKAHPATFPQPLVEFCVKLMTREGDTVYDPFAGSLTVPEVCERLNRRWFASERSLTYLGGAGIRLANAPGFIDHVAMPGLRRAA